MTSQTFRPLQRHCGVLLMPTAWRYGCHLTRRTSVYPASGLNEKCDADYVRWCWLTKRLRTSIIVRLLVPVYYMMMLDAAEDP